VSRAKNRFGSQLTSFPSAAPRIRHRRRAHYCAVSICLLTSPLGQTYFSRVANSFEPYMRIFEKNTEVGIVNRQRF